MSLVLFLVSLGRVRQRLSFLIPGTSDTKNSYLLKILLWVVVPTAMIGFGKIFWPWIIPYSFFEFWRFHGSLSEVVSFAIPVFLWGVVLSAIQRIRTRNSSDENNRAEAFLVSNTFSSLFAGVFEEIGFRWLGFYTAMIVVVFSNWLFLGFAGLEICRWFYLNFEASAANFFTLGYLTPQLYNEQGWYIGAAMIYSNGNFRDGHAYQGLFGLANSWFIGMFMFYLVFHYGLLASILVHFLYDFLIAIVCYADSIVEMAQSNRGIIW